MRPKFDLLPPSYHKEYENLTKLNVTNELELRLLDGALSSTVVLVVVLAIILSLVMTSLLTYCFHKWKLRGKKLQRAQEEYQRDQEKNMAPGTS
ncbi:hypothetical protein FKM82_021074 [Ascaphus truei]